MNHVRIQCDSEGEYLGEWKEIFKKLNAINSEDDGQTQKIKIDLVSFTHENSWQKVLDIVTTKVLNLKMVNFSYLCGGSNPKFKREYIVILVERRSNIAKVRFTKTINVMIKMVEMRTNCLSECCQLFSFS